MHPILDKLMVGACLVGGICVGSYYFADSSRNKSKSVKTIGELLEEKGEKVLNLDVKEDRESTKYKEGWEKLVNNLVLNLEDKLKDFIEVNEIIPQTKSLGYEETIEKLKEKCSILRNSLIGSQGEGDCNYKKAKLFCVELKN